MQAGGILGGKQSTKSQVRREMVVKAISSDCPKIGVIYFCIVLMLTEIHAGRNEKQPIDLEWPCYLISGPKRPTASCISLIAKLTLTTLTQP